MRERDRQSIVGTPSGRMDQETVVRPELKENFKSEGLRDKNASTCDVSLQCDIQTGHLENNVYHHDKQNQELETRQNFSHPAHGGAFAPADFSGPAGGGVCRGPSPGPGRPWN